MGDRRTYFLLLSRGEPRGRRFVRLRSPSVLAWFQRNWATGDDGAYVDELKGEVYGLGSLFEKVAEGGVPAPTTASELPPLLEMYLYYERDIEAEEHFVHVETDDDEVDVEYFFFDDHFLRQPDALERLPKAGRRADRYATFLRELADIDG